MNSTDANTEQVTCKGCGRKLTAPASVATGYGPRCAAIMAATEGLNAKQVDKMQQLIEDNAILPTSRKGVYKVVNEAGETIHTTHVNGHCSCQWGQRRTSAETKVCYMVAAARLLAKPVIRTRPAVTVPAPRQPIALPSSDAIWAELDRMGATAGALAAF